VLDGEATQARGPQGQTGVHWRPGKEVSGEPGIRSRFDGATWRACPARRACPTAKAAPRQLTARTQAHHEAIPAARQRQETAAFNAQYAQRAGSEGTPAQGIRRCGLRQSRHRGGATPHLQPPSPAVALNVVRLGAWWLGPPHANTRCAPLAILRTRAASCGSPAACVRIAMRPWPRA
jgi:hypothetical protein